MSLGLFRSALLASAVSLAATLPRTASAQGTASSSGQDSGSRLGSIEKQIQALQAELRHMKGEMAQRNRELKTARGQTYVGTTPPVSQLTPIMPQIPAGYALVPASPGSAPGSVVLARAEPPPPKLSKGTFRVGAVDVTLGGFVEAASVYRSRNTVSDIATPFNTIPFRYSQLYHESEFHESARQSRLSAALEAHPDEVTKLQALFVTDFLGAGPASNYNESNSWLPRVREAFATYARSDWGFQFLGGQTWTLLTMNKVGVDPYKMNLPLMIDPQYVVGFNWARQAQVRISKSFGRGQYWLAASIENPSGVYANTTIPAALGTLNVSNPGVGVDATGSNSVTSVVTGVTTAGGKTTTTTTNVLTPGNIPADIVPDVVVKGTADFNLGHFEVYGVGRVFHDRLSQLGTGESNTRFGGGAGAAGLIHIVPKLLDVQISGLAGEGVGRYGTSQLPDATIGNRGQPVALPEWQALFGVVAHPAPVVDLYGYLGTEQVASRYFSAVNEGKLTGYGYGNPLYNNTGCNMELSLASTCTANTSGIVEGTVGAWYKFIQGNYGTMQVGASYSYVHRSVFQGVGPTPQTNDNLVFLSFRYYPFQ